MLKYEGGWTMPKSSARASDIDPIRDAWENLGIAFVENRSNSMNCDPERTLLASLKEFHGDRKLLKVILAWLVEYGDLIHVERIKALAPELSANELAWLGGLASHQIHGPQASGDRRWITILELAKKKLGTPGPTIQTSELDALQAQKSGADKCFQSFGITIPVVLAAEPKKLRPRREALNGCLWLRMRSLFGTNWRADVATVMLLKLAGTSYRAGRVLGCSAETAYRNWNSLIEADLPSIMRGLVVRYDDPLSPVGAKWKAAEHDDL